LIDGLTLLNGVDVVLNIIQAIPKNV